MKSGTFCLPAQLYDALPHCPDMTEAPDLMWLAVVTVGFLALGGTMFYATMRYRAAREKRRSRPTDD